MTFTNVAAAPSAAKKPVSSTNHDITTTDDYAWMRADNWQEVMRDPALLAQDINDHLIAENTYQEAVLSDTATLQTKLIEEMKGRIKQDESSVPMKDGDWAYGVSYVEGGEQPIFFRVDSDDISKREEILNGDTEASSKSYFRLGGCSHSPNHLLASWSYDDKGSEYYTLKIRDLATGKELQDVLEDTGGDATWSKDCKQLIYTKLDENHRPSKIYLHTIGDDQSNDKLLFEEDDPGFFSGAGKTQSGKFIILGSHDHQTAESWLLPADNPSAEPILIAERQTEVEYSVDEANGTLYILTNREGATDNKIVTAPAQSPQPENWEDLIPHRPGIMIVGHSVYKNHLVWLERADGLPRILIQELATGDRHEIAFDEEAYSLGLGGAYEFDTEVIRFTYSSMTTPSQTYDYNMQTRERTLLKTQEVPSGHESTDYVTRRLLARGHDGELVPVSLLYHKSTPLDGTAPCLLYGYGSYGMTIPASFNTNCLSLVDRGFIYAIAHVRGGKDKGFAWYENGKREHKTNTFRDFISAAHHLIEESFTSSGKIIAQGGSAGGMLMGAIVNMEPDLFGGIIAEVPFVDVLNTMLDDSLPLTPPEWPEWGNPIASKSDYEAIAAYSPYDNVAETTYPPILAIAGLTDPRVTYWEPAKWVAKLRDHQTGDAPILLKTNMEAGHGGSSGRFKRLEEVAVNYAFALKCVGMT